MEAELKRLGVKQIFIIGGLAVVPDIIKDKLENIGIKTTRLWGQITREFVTSNINSACKANILGGSGVISDKLINNVFSPMGNTNGNLYLKGVAAKQGDWIYVADLNNGIYKCREDGSGFVQLINSPDKVYSINVVDDWVYYTIPDGIYKVKTDGSQNTILDSKKQQ